MPGRCAETGIERKRLPFENVGGAFFFDRVPFPLCFVAEKYVEKGL